MISKKDVQKMLNNTDMLKLAFHVIGYQHEDTVESLKEMERVINEVYPLGHHPMPTTVFAFGLHVGNVIVKSIPGAQWVIEEVKDPFDIRIKIQKGEMKSEIFPIIRVQKFWFDRTDTLYGWVQMIRDILSGAINLDKNENIWQIRPDGTRIRMHRVSEEEYKQTKKGRTK